MYSKILPAWLERDKLRAEGDKLHAEGDKLDAEGYKLYAEGDKLYAEGNYTFASAVGEVCGRQATMEWNDDKTECTVMGVMHFAPK